MISTKGRYALNFMLDLSLNYTGKPIRLKDIANRQRLSEKYLEHIASGLHKRGLISSIRGVNGGYFLSRDAKDIKVGEILRVMEGDLAPAPCLQEGINNCEREKFCHNRILWQRLNDAINGVIDSISLYDMQSWVQ